MDFIATPWGFGSITVVAVAILAIVWRVGYLSLSKAGILIGKGGTPKKVSPHATCPHAKDIMGIVHRTTEHIEKRQELKTQLLEEQMRFYEETEEEILGVMKAIYLSLMSEKAGEGVSYVQHPEYTAYVMTLRAISHDIKSYVRGCFKANHYVELTPEEQRQYIEKKETVIVQKVTEALNLYWRGTVVTREELYKEHKKHMSDFEGYVNEIFNRAFLLARETNEKLTRMEKEYNEYIQDMLGTGQ